MNFHHIIHILHTCQTRSVQGMTTETSTRHHYITFGDCILRIGDCTAVGVAFTRMLGVIGSRKIHTDYVLQEVTSQRLHPRGRPRQMMLDWMMEE